MKINLVLIVFHLLFIGYQLVGTVAMIHQPLFDKLVRHQLPLPLALNFLVLPLAIFLGFSDGYARTLGNVSLISNVSLSLIGMVLSITRTRAFRTSKIALRPTSALWITFFSVMSAVFILMKVVGWVGSGLDFSVYGFVDRRGQLAIAFFNSVFFAGLFQRFLKTENANAPVDDLVTPLAFILAAVGGVLLPSATLYFAQPEVLNVFYLLFLVTAILGREKETWRMLSTRRAMLIVGTKSIMLGALIMLALQAWA